MNLPSFLEVARGLRRGFALLEGSAARVLFSLVFFLFAAGASWAVAPTVVASTTAITSGATTITIAAPAGIVAADVLIAHISQRNTGAVATTSSPAGWTRQVLIEDSPANSLNTVEVWVKVATAADVGASYTWGLGNTDRAAGSIMAFRGVDTVTPVEVQSSSIYPAAATWRAPAATSLTATSGTLVLFSGGNGNGTSFSAFSGGPSYSSLYFAASGAGPNGTSITGYYGTPAAPATVGPYTINSGIGGCCGTVNEGITLILRPVGPSNFLVAPASATPSTCAATYSTVTARYSDGSTATTFNGAITFTTTTGHGTWSLRTGAGTFVAGAADSGQATYTFSASDLGVASFFLSDQRSETLTESVAWGTRASGTSTSVSFSDNSFVIAPSDPLGLQAVAGRPHAFTASFQRRDATTGVCGAVTGYAGGKALDAWYSATGSHPAGAAAPALSSASTCAGSVSLPASAPAISAASNNLALTFASGVATFYLCTADVGQYAINLRDDTLSYAGTVVLGASGAATARPFALWIDNVASGAIANPAGTATSGAKFVPAQTAFSARATAKLWAAGQDSASAGQPNAGVDLSANGSTASFAAASTIATVASSQTPSAGALGTLSGGAIPAASFASGQATASSLSYSEAGSAKLVGTSSNYLGSGFAVPGVSTADVGRFYPASLVLAATASTYATPACAAGGFTYMDQPFSLGAQLSAQGSAGAVLSNYDAALGYAFLAAPAWRAVDAANGVNLGARLSTGAAPSWAAGRWTYANAATLFQRAATGPDGQYDSLRLGLSGADADGAAISSLDMSYTVAGACSGAGCDAKGVGPAAKMRYGRLQIDSAFGAVLPTLRMPVQAMYWTRAGSGSSLGWSVNTLDSCTSLPYASLAMGGYAGGLSAGSVTVPAGSLALASGAGVIAATRSGNATVAGSVTLAANLGSAAASPVGCASGMPSVPGANLDHLKSNFCSAGYAGNPGAKSVWGAPASKSGSTVFIRELY